MAWNIPAAIAAATDRTAAWFQAISDSFAALSAHDHSGVDGDGAALSGFKTPSLVMVVPGHFTTDDAGKSTSVRDEDILYAGYGRATGVSANRYLEYSVFLTAGTYLIGFVYGKDSDAGILTLRVNGVAQAGTFDSYAASASFNHTASWSSIVIATTGTHTIRVIAITKNASSTGHAVRVQGLHFVRTSA